MSQVINGNQVYLDEVRGRWTVLFAADNRRQQFATEEEAIVAAGGDPEQLGNRKTDVVPKQAVDNTLTKKSNAKEKLDKEVQDSVTQTVAAEGSVLNTSVGNEKDGFTSLTAATTKGTANEGPAVAVMGGNIKQGNVTKTVSSSTKLSGVTGGTKGTTAVLNETVVQASPKGITQALTTTVGLNSQQVQAAISESSPIPSQVQAAVKSVVEEGGPAKKAAVNVLAAAKASAEENGNPFGSLNPFGSIGSQFGNIMGQVTAIATGAAAYKNPLNVLKAAVASKLTNRLGELIPTPDIINSNGTTNLKNIITKSKLENALVKVLPNTARPGQRTQGWNGITTKLKGYHISGVENQPELAKALKQESIDGGVAEGGTYIIPTINNQAELEAELKAIERPITTLIVRHSGNRSKNRYLAEDYHVFVRRNLIKKYGESAVNASPEDYCLPSHLMVDAQGTLKLITPFKKEIPKDYGGKDFWPNSVHVWLEGSGHSTNKVNSTQLKSFGLIAKVFLKVFPGGEVLGISDVSDKEKHRNIPFFDVREYTSSKLRKPSVTEENKPAVVPAPADLANAQPKNVVIPKKSPNARPNVSAIASTQNKIAAPPNPVNLQNYLNSQNQALDLIKEKKNAINIADLTTGSGLTSSLGSVANLASTTSLSSTLLSSVTGALPSGPLGTIGGAIAGSLVDKITRSNSTANNLLDAAQDFKVGQLKLGKVWDSVTGVFK